MNCGDWIAERERYLSATASKALLVERNNLDAFNKIRSRREQQLFGMFDRGLSNEEIAIAVNLSEFTVRNHRCRTMAKLGLRATAKLIRYALEKGFILKTGRCMVHWKMPMPI